MNIGLIAHDAKKKINAEFFVSLIVEYSANTVCMQRKLQEH